jgi:hypothetical protein
LDASAQGFTLWSRLPRICVQGGKAAKSTNTMEKAGFDGSVTIL